MKKILTVFLIFSLLIGFVPIVNAATNNITLTSSTSSVNVGDTVTLTMKTAQKIQAADFSLKYSNSILQLESASISTDNYTDKTGTIQVCYYSTSGVDTFTFTFKAIAKGSATVTTDIESLYIDQNDGNTLDFENESINITAIEKPTTVDVTSVTLNKTTASLKVGKTLKLTATILPENATDKTITWKSSDASVATVSNGTVTGVKAGTATITATAGTKSATCTITVTEDEIDDPSKIEVTSITLDKTTASLKVGETLKLTATVLPETATDKTVTWKSSDTSVATVSNGTVTGVKAGTATITATAGTKSATCTITVTEDKIDAPSKIEVTSIALDKTTASLKVGETLKLTATILPENATDKTITWKSSDTSVATVSNGKVIGVKAGTAKITATVGEKSATCTITVTENKTNSSNIDKDDTTSTSPIPQTGETLRTIGIIVATVGIATVSIIKYRKYRKYRDI